MKTRHQSLYLIPVYGLQSLVLLSFLFWIHWPKQSKIRSWTHLLSSMQPPIQHYPLNSMPPATHLTLITPHLDDRCNHFSIRQKSDPVCISDMPVEMSLIQNYKQLSYNENGVCVLFRYQSEFHTIVIYWLHNTTINEHFFFFIYAKFIKSNVENQSVF